MKDHKFYVEYPSTFDKRENTRGDNCLVIFGESFISGNEIVYECVATVSMQERPNCPAIAESQVSVGHLRKFCKRVSEKRAREIHPNLFAYLEA